MSPVSLEIRSPSLRRSKKSSDRLCRWRKKPCGARAGSARRPRWRCSCRERGDAAGERQAEVGERDPPEGAEVVRDQHAVDDDLEHPDRGGLDRGDDGDQDQADQQPAPIRASVGPEAPEDLPDRDRWCSRDQRVVLEQRFEEGSNSSSHRVSATTKPRRRRGPIGRRAPA
jgi:hypothetical protein